MASHHARTAAASGSARTFVLTDNELGFEPSPTDPNNLQIIIKDIKASFEREA